VKWGREPKAHKKKSLTNHYFLLHNTVVIVFPNLSQMMPKFKALSMVFFSIWYLKFSKDEPIAVYTLSKGQGTILKYYTNKYTNTYV